MKTFKIKFGNFCCDKCYSKLHTTEIYKKLKEQYEEATDANGYTSILSAKCTGCGRRYKVYFDCHEINNVITVCVNRIVEVNI